MLDIDGIKQVIPHRYPFLLIDRIEEHDPGSRAVGFKNVTANEPFFQGHFPDFPVMPGVLIVEALAQVGAVALLSLEANRGKLAFFAGHRQGAVQETGATRRHPSARSRDHQVQSGHRFRRGDRDRRRRDRVLG